jgi:hypothetical protein
MPLDVTVFKNKKVSKKVFDSYNIESINILDLFLKIVKIIKIPGNSIGKIRTIFLHYKKSHY